MNRFSTIRKIHRNLKVLSSVHDPAPQFSHFQLSATQTRNKYQSQVIDHFKNPRNMGELDTKSLNVGTALKGAPACGDVMKLQIEVDENDVIKNAKFKTFGCGSAIASSSYATELIIGKTLDEAIAIKNKDIAQHLALPPVKLHCSMLAEDAIRGAVYDLKKKREEAKNNASKQNEGI